MSEPSASAPEHDVFEGIYGRYRMTAEDAQEVQRYRQSLLLCGITFVGGMGQWLAWGPAHVGLWLLPMAIGLGLALHWIHIYLRPLHRALQILWAIGCVGLSWLALESGSEPMVTSVSDQPLWIWAIGPFFAALAGVGFKEFFCFRRPEAIGLTLLLPMALLGYLSGLMGAALSGGLLLLAAVLQLVLALRKFGGPAAADVGDKSVFAYLEAHRMARNA
jgi:uncharacterized integral membrane protein